MTAAMTTDMAHPSWCDPERCTGEPVARTLDGYRALARAGGGGVHRSRVLVLDTSLFLWPLDDLTACLTQGVAPWRCTTFLRLVLAGRELVSIPADTAGAQLDQLRELLDHDAEVQ